MRNLSIFVFSSLMFLLLSGCATGALDIQSPQLSVLSAKPTKMGITNQEFTFNIKADNPNQFRIPLSITDFVVKFNNQEVAQGVYNNPVTLPANGSQEMALSINTNLMSSMTGMWRQIAAGKFSFDYELAGSFKVDFGVLPFTVPYKLKGNLLDQVTGG